jgi:cytochrome b6-f complex iron-sulfur subunit
MNSNHQTRIKSAQLNRRRFLTWCTHGSLAATVALAIGQVARFMSFQPPNTTPTVIAASKPDEYTLDEWVYVAEARAYISRDGEGLYALDAVCPHLGCLVERKKRGEGFTCPCHGSNFDAVGQAENGPATKPLQYLSLLVDPKEGLLMVDRSQQVEPTTRLVI